MSKNELSENESIIILKNDKDEYISIKVPTELAMKFWDICNNIRYGQKND